MSTLTQFRPKESGGGGGGGGVDASYIPVTTDDATLTLNPTAASYFFISKEGANTTIDLDITKSDVSSGVIVVDYSSGTHLDAVKFTSKFKGNDAVFATYPASPAMMADEASSTVDASTLGSGSIWGTRFNEDGTLFFLTEGNNIQSFTLAPEDAFDLSAVPTASSTTYTLSGNNYDCWDFSDDGLSMFYIDTGTSTLDVFKATLTTPYDLSTASAATNVYTVTGKPGTGASFARFNGDGTKIIHSSVDVDDKNACVLSLSTPYDASTITGHIFSWLSCSRTQTRGISLVRDDIFFVPNVGSNPIVAVSEFTTATDSVLPKYKYLSKHHGGSETREYQGLGKGWALLRGIGGTSMVSMYKLKPFVKYSYTQIGSDVYIDNIEGAGL